MYREARYGTAEYQRLIRTRMASAFNAQGSLFVADTSTVANLFASNRVYAKGASVLHMLRHVMGDSAFFLAIRRYAADDRFRYGTASTSDFQSVCEGVYGRSLGWFFTEWVFGERYPQYTLRWSARASGDRFTIDAQLSQETHTTTPSFFTMPVDVRFSSGTRDTTVVLWNTQKSETFSFDLPFRPATAAVDPEMWILRDIVDPEPLIPLTLTLDQNYPNPFNGGTTIPVHFPRRTPAALEVYSLLGARVATLFNGTAEAGTRTWTWDGRNDSGIRVASGVYLCRILTTAGSQTRSMIFLR